MEKKLTVDKAAVYEEVAQTTEYTGAKMMGADTGAHERITTDDEDASALERFWTEARAMVCQELKRLLSDERMTGGRYEVTLELSASFDQTLLPSMEEALRQYFVLWVTARWFGYTNKGESAEYAASAKGMLEDVKRKAMYRKKPVRPVY